MPTWTSANNAANVVNQVFTYSGPEKPATSTANLDGSWIPAYTPSRSATAHPASRISTNGVATASRLGVTGRVGSVPGASVRLTVRPPCRSRRPGKR